VARILAIDWDHEFLHVIAGNTGRGGVSVDRAFVWSIGGELTPQNGEALGHKLREALKSAGAAAGPVVASLGRERVVVKELRFPPVPPADEPALVRFQAAKDLSELPDDVVIDYAKISPPDAAGERQALAVALKKQTFKGLQALCQGAGLKLAAVTTRSSALAGTVERAQALGAAPVHETVAVLVVGRRWAELAVLNQGRVLLTRALAVGATLTGEVQRSLAMFLMQKGNVPAPEVLLVAGQRDPAVEANLKDLVGVNVQRLEPLGVADQTVEGERGLYAAAVGAAHLWGKQGALAINFAAPKEPKPRVDPNRSRKLVYGAAAAALLIAALVGGNRVLAAKRVEIEQLRQMKTELDEQYKKMAQDRLDIEGLKEWEETTVSWLDEFYDLSARFPHQVGFRLKDITATPPSKRGGKDKIAGQISITGVARADQIGHVNDFIDSLRNDRYLKASPGPVKTVAGGAQEFQIKVDVTRRPLDHYTIRFMPPPRGLMEEGEPEDGEMPGGDMPGAENVEGGAP
jgi:Tfp pilus assembly PilM family ATPase